MPWVIKCCKNYFIIFLNVKLYQNKPVHDDFVESTYSVRLGHYQQYFKLLFTLNIKSLKEK